MPDSSFLTPEMFAMLVNNGLGGVAVVLLFRVNQQIAQMIATDANHELRLKMVENALIARNLQN